MKREILPVVYQHIANYPDYLAGGEWHVDHQLGFYALCDNMGSKVAITNAAGTVLERYAFSAFGELESVMAADYSLRAASLYGWQTLFHGEVRDVTRVGTTTVCAAARQVALTRSDRRSRRNQLVCVRAE